ncbi:hypothetical protein [Synechococcus sp. MIT S9508]|uniref:hypothetical protein n=1 Tax=Synechococcus sp. MIT S9508 TaxID=1801629 RepID=UPI0007BB30DD|nr:hypothetical protein [Synechococcus sp. MIT S9508]KZR87030.1 hypothetical protein MITS9508_02497 [Synechococcus sp. MIT S9508]
MSEQTENQIVYTIHSSIAASQRQDYQSIQERMNHAAQAFSGYLGQDVVYEESDTGPAVKVTTHVRFKELEQCLRWLDSPQRRELLNQAEKLISYHYRFRLDSNSFDQWIQAKGPSQKPIWKVNLLVWLALYPSVMLLMWLSGPTLGNLPMPLNMLISNLITVLLTGYLLVPWLSRIYANWLSTTSRRWTLAGCTTILVAQGLLLTLFSTVPGLPWKTPEL